MRRWICVWALVGACGGGGGEGDAALDAPVIVDAGGPREWPAAEVPAVTEPEPGIRREVLMLEGHPAPPNPSTGDATPDALDRVQVVRYSGMDEPDVRAVVVAMPGIFGGAGSFDPLARNMVRRSLEDAPIEVWVIDRRSNLLEDLRGLDAAEASENADIARGYYFGGETVGGERFEGFLSQEDVPYMSEWGLETHLEDLRRVIERVPAERVFLMGHSLGASMTEAFAAWRFESVRGAELVAGLILVDGTAGTSPLSETEYREGTGGGFMALPGVEAIRSSTRYLALPLLGVEVYPRAEIAAMDALWAPDLVRVDRGRAMVLSTLMSLPVGRLPPMTNAGAFGFAFDDRSNGLSFAAVGMGRPTGGPVESYESLFGGTLERPSDSDATYDWVDARDVEPPELTPLANLAHSWIDGRTNFAEWYFPVRLTLDLAAVGGLAVDPDGWQAERGLRAFDGALVDAPILAVAAALAPAERYDAARARAAPVGEGRPNAGATRDEARGFSVVDASAQTHIDPLSAADVPENPVPGAVLEFVYANAAAGRAALAP